MLYKFVVPGKPVAKDRPRMNNAGKMYTPLKTKAYEELVHAKAREVMREPLRGDVRVDIKIYAKNLRGDIDNIAKTILDGMTGVAYLNDRQVKVLYVEAMESMFERVEVDLSEREVEKNNDTWNRNTTLRRTCD